MLDLIYRRMFSKSAFRSLNVPMLAFAFVLAHLSGFAQQPFAIEVRPSAITVMPEVHSGAFAKWDGKWIYIGGRSNGLHGFLPPSSFPFSNINDSVFVVDPQLNQRWSMSLASLPDSLREPLLSSNMESFQDSATLYMVGGYGWKTTQNNFITFNTLTAVDLPGLLAAVMNNTPSQSLFRQMSDSVLTVCGGHLERLGNTYQLVFGHYFNGFYSINSNGGFYSQQYTCEVRRFKIIDDGVNLSLQDYSALRDTDNFHRRDYNLVPQILLDESYGLTAFSGVFQYYANLPYTGTVDIAETYANPNTYFVQQFANYHCAAMPLYNSVSRKMSTVFFGGMGMFFKDTVTRQLICDTLVPFVNTISVVDRDGLGQVSETLLPASMPGYAGTNALFVVNDSLSLLHDAILDFQHLDTLVRAGYIISGISSSDRNISSINSTMSYANGAVYEVWLKKIPQAALSVDAANANRLVEWSTFPNPASTVLNVSLNMPTSTVVDLDLLDLKGSRLKRYSLHQQVSEGKSCLTFNVSDLPAGNYICRMQAAGHTWARLVTIRPSLAK